MLKDRLKDEEGFRLYQYKDTKGFWTIYWGHKINPGETFNHTMEEAEDVLDKDIAIAVKATENLFPNFVSFTQARQDALTELVFNMGAGKIAKSFPRFVHNINIGSWDGAAAELKYADGKSVLSNWYKQVHPQRADVIINELIEG
jgi:GH24 family phage-related lysozyme (muramidase)